MHSTPFRWFISSVIVCHERNPWRHQKTRLKKYHLNLLKETSGGQPGQRHSWAHKLRHLESFTGIKELGTVGFKETAPYQKAGYQLAPPSWWNFLEVAWPMIWGLQNCANTALLQSEKEKGNAGTTFAYATSLIYNWEMEAPNSRPAWKSLPIRAPSAIRTFRGSANTM